MKTLLLSFLLLLSVESFSQRYVSNFMSSYEIIEEDYKFIESSIEQNIFTVKDGFIIWTSDVVVRYRINDVRFIDGTIHYLLLGKNNHPLLLSVKDNILVLIFHSEHGNRYAIKFSLEDRI